MEDLDPQRGDETANEQHGKSPHQQRRRDRRIDTASLFGGYDGPERRSGRDRRSQ